jgi:hypothetical protein
MPLRRANNGAPSRRGAVKEPKHVAAQAHNDTRLKDIAS